MHLSRNTRDALRARALNAYACHNDRRAVHLWKRLAKAGDGEAAWRVGSMYHNGEGVKQSFQLTMRWYERAGQLGYEPTASAPNLSVEIERRVALGYRPTGRIDQSQNWPPLRDSGGLRRSAIVGGLITSAVVFGGVLGWLYIGSSGRTPQLAQVGPNDETGAIPQGIVPGQASRSEDRPDEPQLSIARMSILGQDVEARVSPPERTGINSQVQDAAEAVLSRLPRTATEFVRRALSGNVSTKPASRPDVRNGQAILPSPPPWDAEVPDRNKIVDTLTAPRRLAPPPKSPGISPTGYDEPPIVLIARAEVLVRVLDADNNALVDRRFQPGDSYTVPNREGLVLVSEAPDKLDIIIDGETIQPAKTVRPWAHIPLNAAHLAPTE